MTNDPNSMLNTFKDALAPVTEALKGFQPDVPDAARDFVKRGASAAKQHAAELHSSAEKMTGAIETAVAGSLSETVKAARGVQQAIYEDTEALLSGLDRLASAKSLTEAVEIQSDLIRSRGEAVAARAKSATEYAGKLFADGTKTLRDTFAEATQFNRKVG
ncbi:MAG: phasin family protein [Xanthobacteraceae bacterium]|nr:phasin family protein [Xanthobacteraceae bacterium]